VKISFPEVSSEALNKLDYEVMANQLKERGITNPWQQFDDAAATQFGLSRMDDHPDISKRLVYAGSALASTVMLRLGDLAQPLVNMISLPILTHLAAAQKMPEHFMGVQLGTVRGVTAPQVMYEGFRASNSPTWATLGKQWEDAGYFSPMISEINKTLHMTRALDKGAIAATERGETWKRLSNEVCLKRVREELAKLHEKLNYAHVVEKEAILMQTADVANFLAFLVMNIYAEHGKD